MQETKEENIVVYLSNNDILPNRFQPRKYFDEEEIMQLSESIKEHGVINPVIVRKLGDKYELVAGERRYKANILAGNDNIPAIIMDVNDKESSEIAVVENIQRKDLNAIEEAISYKRILDIGYMTQEQLAQKMGKSQSAIANKIRLLKLSDEVQDALMKKEISERHARSLLKLDSHKKQNELLKRIVNERLTVRRTDEEIEKMNNNIYNNSPDSLAPIMPESNISDVNISGIQNNAVENFNQGYVEPTSTMQTPIQTVQQPQPMQETLVQPVLSEIPSIQPQTSLPNQNESIVPPVENSQPVQPIIQPSTEQKPQSIPTVSIDDVLAKANQPSVVGPQVFTQPQQPVNNIVENPAMPKLDAINETPSPIEPPKAKTDTFEMPALNPINEFPEELESVNNLNFNQGINQPLENNNQNANNFEFPGLNITNNENVLNDNQINNDFSGVNGMPLNDVIPTFNLNTNNDDNNNSPIATSPIIDTSMNQQNNNSIEENNELGNNILNNNINTNNTTKFEKVPEPIIVNDYDSQYDPIMPKNQNAQPAIDFKTIINLIRKCSQAIENSGYKIETEEYNLDNLYQVVFKIDKK